MRIATREEADATVPVKTGAEAVPVPLAALPSGLKRCPHCGGEYPSDFVVCPRDATPLVAADAGADPLFGQVLANSYRVLGVIGEGGMGKLYEAEHLRIDRRFAVKVILPEHARVNALVARFDREGKAMSRIRSDHVVDVVDVTRAPDGRPCIVCEKLVGEDLETRLERDGKIAIPEAIGIVRQACRGLADAHALGIVHRDLKPSNLYLAQAPSGTTVKVLDFGVAKVDDEEQNLTRTGAVVGTPQYMSPEQARGSAHVDVRTDVYAMGAVLYRMLTGRPPYSGDDDASTTLVRLLEEDPERPRAHDRTIPEGVESVIQRAMARDPAARPQSIEELDAQLALFEHGAFGAPPSTGRFTTLSGQQGGQDAAAITRDAKRLRPVAIGLVMLAPLVTALVVVTVLGNVVGALTAQGAIAGTEALLVGIAGLVTWIGVFVTHVRSLRARWRSAPAVAELTSKVTRGLAFGLLALGGAELATRAWAFAELMPSVQPAWLNAAVAALAGAVGLGGLLTKKA